MSLTFYIYIITEPINTRPGDGVCFLKCFENRLVVLCVVFENWPIHVSRLLLVGRFGSGSGSVFRYSRYSMGSLRGEAPHNSRVGGLGERRLSSPQEIQRGRGDAVPLVR